MVTHDDLAARMARGEDRFLAIEGKLNNLVDVCTAVQITLAEVKVAVGINGETATAARADIHTIHERVATLEASENVRKGERGAWSAICRSPFLAWVFAAFAGFWAYLVGEGVVK